VIRYVILRAGDRDRNRTLERNVLSVAIATIMARNESDGGD
jgi:hypothetical protein